MSKRTAGCAKEIGYGFDRLFFPFKKVFSHRQAWVRKVKQRIALQENACGNALKVWKRGVGPERFRGQPFLPPQIIFRRGDGWPWDRPSGILKGIGRRKAGRCEGEKPGCGGRKRDKFGVPETEPWIYWRHTRSNNRDRCCKPAWKAGVYQSDGSRHSIGTDDTERG
jgi:hypothetical protein